MAVGTVSVKVVPDLSDFAANIERTRLLLLLLNFSEWLDSQGLVVGDQVSNDKRTHEQLAADFLAERAPTREEKDED